MNVLIVEPNRSLCALWQAHLQRQGWGVFSAHDKATAFVQLEQCHPDIVVVSADLPDKGGFSLADWVGFRQPGTRVIFVSADSFFSDGSIFHMAPNACAVLPASVRPSDLCAMAEHYAAPRSWGAS